MAIHARDLRLLRRHEIDRCQVANVYLLTLRAGHDDATEVVWAREEPTDFQVKLASTLRDAAVSEPCALNSGIL